MAGRLRPGVVVYGTEFSQVRVRFVNDGDVDLRAVWYKIPQASSYAEEGGEAPTREAPTFDGVGQRSGNLRLPTISIAAVYPLFDWVISKVEDAALSKEVVDIEFATRSDEIVIQEGGAADTAAISASGAVTLAGALLNANVKANNRIQPGLALKIGANYYRIVSVDGATGAITVPKPAGAVVATKFSIILPQVSRGPVGCEITVAGRISAEAESNITTAIGLAPVGQLPKLKQGVSV